MSGRQNNIHLRCRIITYLNPERQIERQTFARILRNGCTSCFCRSVSLFAGRKTFPSILGNFAATEDSLRQSPKEWRRILNLELSDWVWRRIPVIPWLNLSPPNTQNLQKLCHKPRKYVGGTQKRHRNGLEYVSEV